MSELDHLLRRLERDPAFRDAVERDPAAALEGLDLTDDDLSRLDAAVRRPTVSVERFFEPAADPRPADPEEPTSR